MPRQPQFTGCCYKVPAAYRAGYKQTRGRIQLMRDLLLLHAALGAQSQFDSLVEELRVDYTLHMLDFESHGARQPTDRPFSIESFADNVVELLDAKRLQT